MSTITKEWLKQKIAEMEAARDDIPFGLGEDGTNTLAALRIALASLEAEKEYKHHSIIAEQLDHVLSSMDATDHQRAVISCAVDRLNNVSQLLQASPSALLVPETLDYQGAKELFNYLMNEEETNATVNGWNACRAAMLQSFGNSEQLNSPVIPDGWVACSERMPETMVSVLVTGTWFHHAVAFWDGLSWCDLDFEPPVTHWMPLPAAPKQELK